MAGQRSITLVADTVAAELIRRNTWAPNLKWVEVFRPRARWSDTVTADREMIAQSDEVKLYAKELEIRKLEQGNLVLRRRLDTSSGWAPGGLGRRF